MMCQLPFDQERTPPSPPRPSCEDTYEGKLGSSNPVPSFPLRWKILAQGGSLLVSVYLVLLVLATCFC